MEWIAAAVVQLAVAILTLSVSLDLRPRQFADALAAPKPLLAGLLVQLVTVPVLVLLLATGVRDATVLTALCLVAFTPSGPTSNYLAHVARGDVPLAILLTVAGTLLSAAVMPLALPWLLHLVTGGAIAVVTPLAVLQGLVWMVLVPLLLGLYAGHRHPALVARWRTRVTRVAGALFMLLVAGAIASQWRALSAAAGAAVVPVLAINASALACGLAAGTLAGLARPQRDTLALKTGVQNVSIAIGVAIGVLGRVDVAAVAALYGVTQLLVASAFALAAARRVRAAPIP
jgi:bile acid:Na+ symporter, BASS family